MTKQKVYKQINISKIYCKSKIKDHTVAIVSLMMSDKHKVKYDMHKDFIFYD